MATAKGQENVRIDNRGRILAFKIGEESTEVPAIIVQEPRARSAEFGDKIGDDGLHLLRVKPPDRAAMARHQLKRMREDDMSLPSIGRHDDRPRPKHTPLARRLKGIPAQERRYRRQPDFVANLDAVGEVLLHLRDEFL